jgi:two-component system response regulator NreC
MHKMRVLLADDHAILREGLRHMLEHYNDVEVVGEAADGAEAVARASELSPDIVLMDVAMPGLNGIRATRLIRQRCPATQVLALSQHEDRRYVASMLRAGVAGYIPKAALGADLIAALRAVARGEVYLHPRLSAVAMQEIRADAQLLTPREAEILQLVVDGRTSAEIAQALSLSVNTVDWHRSHVMGKLGARNVADLIRRARERGLIGVDD